MTVKCKCGKLIIYSRNANNQLIYRCMDPNCYCARDITEKEYKKLQQEQDSAFKGRAL